MNYTLKQAIKHGDLDGVNRFLNNGGNVNEVIYKSMTPVHYAVSYRNLHEDEDDVELGTAYTHVDDEILFRLLSAGADVNDRGDGNSTPLMHVMKSRRSFEVVRRLLDSGADVNALTSPEGDNMLVCAIKNKYDKEMIALLVRTGANVNRVNGDPLRRTALFYALVNNDPEIVMALINCGADVTVHNLFGANALMVIGCKNCEEGDCKYVSIINLLLDKGIDIKEKDLDGNTIIHKVDCNYLIDLSIRSGVSVNAISNEGLTPLMYSICTGNFEKVNNLLRLFNADCNCLAWPTYMCDLTVRLLFPQDFYLSPYFVKYVKLFVYHGGDMFERGCKNSVHRLFWLIYRSTDSVIEVMKHVVLYFDDECNNNLYEKCHPHFADLCRQELSTMKNKFIVDGLTFHKFILIKKLYKSDFIDITLNEAKYNYEEIKESFPLYGDLIIMRIKDNQYERFKRVLFKSLEEIIVRPFTIGDNDVSLDYDCLRHYVACHLNYKQLYNLFLASL